MDDKRVADYFVVGGLPEVAVPLDEVSRDGNSPKTSQPLVPITDIAVIIRSQGEIPPKGYTCIELTPFGFPADLNHGSLRSPNIYLCYRRGRDKPPLVDVGVLYDGKERVMADSEVVFTTPFGRPANVNNSGSKTFLTYRRALDNAPCNQLVVTDICVILANKSELPPRAFCMIDKNLNKGVLGSDVYLCYKKSMNRPDMMCYKPGVLGRFPLEDYESFALPLSVALFCLPMGATVECWPKSAAEPKPLFSTFVLTSDSAQKVYGAAVTFYEKFPDEKLTDAVRTHLNYTTEDHCRTKDIHANKSICILSRWPFYDTFEKFLRYLHIMSIAGSHKVPLERIISHFMLEIPFPSPQRPRILIQLADCTVSLSQPEDTPLPLSGASYVQLLKTLGPDNCLKVLFYVLTEQKILFHSLRPDVLTSVAEAVVHFIFPFHWQCPYIPLCPLGLSDVLCAPVPFLVGVDSRYFDLYDPPQDVTCVDLDTNSIFQSIEKRSHNVKLLPKRPARVLRNSLHLLYKRLGSIRNSAPSKGNPTNHAMLLDYDFKAKKKECQLELEIQDAFLRFMSSLLKGYRQFLKPITTAPTIGTTDPNSLFDLQGFLRSRDKTHSRFYVCMMKTQMFIRFIEERSFVSDKDAGLAFFDECTEKVDLNDSCDCRLLELDDSQKSDRTVFIAPPEPIGLPPGVEYKYKEFGILKPMLYHRHPAKSLLSTTLSSSPLPNSPMARRTKQEIKCAMKVARKQSETPVMWARCLVGYCFTLWFVHLPSFVKVSPSKSSALRMAFDVLARMQECRLSAPEEVCYRVLMLLCGLYSQPTLAVKVLFEMKRNGIQPNAITYGYYNKAVLESKWPSADAGSTLMWNRLRNVIMGVAQFRQGIKKKARRSLSLCSDIDYDRLSRTSTESSNPEDITLLKVNNPAEFITDLIKLDDHSSSGGQSDCGYSSLNQEEGVKAVPSPQSTVSPTKDDQLEKNPENKTEEKKAVDETVSLAKRSLKFCDIDFSISDEFRSRTGSIVKSSATSLNSLARLQDSSVDSAAGILMTSQSSLFEECDASTCDPELRRRHKSAGEHSCRHKRRHKVRHCSGTFNENADITEVPAPFQRSYSFGNDFQIIRKIREAKEGFEKNGLVTKLFDSPLKKSFTSEKNKETKELGGWNFGLSQCPEETEADLDTSYQSTKDPARFRERMRSQSVPKVIGREIKEGSEKNGLVTKLFDSPLKSFASDKCKETKDLGGQNLNLSKCPEEAEANVDASHPLTKDIARFRERSRSPSVSKLLDTISESQSISPSTSDSVKTVLGNGSLPNSQTDSELNSNKTTPLKDTWMNWDIFSNGALPRMASSISNSLGFNQSTDQERTPRSHKVTRSSTFHSGGARNALLKAKSKTEDMSELDYKDGEKMSRSSTLPVTPRSKSVSGNKLPGMTSSGWPFSVNTPNFGISRLTSRHSEVLMGSLKSAVTTVSAKLNEMKISLSATNTPTKGNYGSGVNRDPSRMGYYVDDDICGFSPDSHLINVDCLNFNSRTDDIFFTDARKGSFKQDPKGDIPHVGSAPAFSSQVFEMFDRNNDAHFDLGNVFKTAVEITMTTCSRCMSCSSLLYDEEIMEKWSADDSNLNTQCTFCKTKMVPSLTVIIKDFRWEGSSESLLTPAYSTESVSSAPLSSNPSGLKTGPIHNRPRSLGEKNSTKNSSIDSSTEPFILLEDSPERDVTDHLSENSVPIDVNNKNTDRPVATYEEALSRNSVASSLEDGDICGSAHSSSRKLSQQSQSIHSSGGDILQNTFNGQSMEPITVPYLSPLVLRKELENVLEHEGDNCMTKPEFVDQHPIIFWNLVWFFKRIGVPTHLSSLILQAQSIIKGKQIPEIWRKGDSKNVVIHCAWDNAKLHEDMGLPLYMLWSHQENGGELSSLIHALVTDENKASKSVMKHVLAKLQCNDLYPPICMLINERRKSPSTRKRYHSIYREILFLSFVAINREDIDNLTFDVEYRKAHDKLSDRQLSQLQVNDRPPSEGAVFCRRYFKDLELKVR